MSPRVSTPGTKLWPSCWYPPIRMRGTLIPLVLRGSRAGAAIVSFPAAPPSACGRAHEQGFALEERLLAMASLEPNQDEPADRDARGARVKITEVRATTCDVPLPRPIIMGDIRYDSREYVVVEILSDSGATGIGFGMTRGSPVASIVNRSLAPLLVGQDPLLSEALWDRLYYRNLPIGQRGIFMRALSAVDIAIWDLKGQQAGLPVWQLLGGAR